MPFHGTAVQKRDNASLVTITRFETGHRGTVLPGVSFRAL